LRRRRIKVPRSMVCYPRGLLLEATSDRSQQRRVAISEGLERVRCTLTDAEFAQLVEDVARTAERLLARALDAQPALNEPTEQA
jgi:hypothetical protein